MIEGSVTAHHVNCNIIPREKRHNWTRPARGVRGRGEGIELWEFSVKVGGGKGHLEGDTHLPSGRLRPCVCVCVPLGLRRHWDRRIGILVGEEKAKRVPGELMMRQGESCGGGLRRHNAHPWKPQPLEGFHIGEEAP